MFVDTEVTPEILWIKYLQILICREALHEFEKNLESIGSTTNGHLNQIFMGLGKYFSD